MKSTVKLRPWPCCRCGVDTFKPQGGISFHLDDTDPDSPDMCCACKNTQLAEKQYAQRLARRL